jgi:hypothetical protein
VIEDPTIRDSFAVAIQRFIDWGFEDPGFDDERFRISDR